MPRVADELIRPLLRALDDIPVHGRQLGGMVRGLRRQQRTNRDGVTDVDRFTDRPGRVREFDVSTYRNLRGRERVGDGMQHDHIPSSAALIRARENELGHALSRSERRRLHNEAIAVELSDLMHSLSRTYKGRNTQAQIDLDASDLRAAMERDLRTLRTNLVQDGRFTPDQIASVMDAIRDLNRKRGIG